MRPPLPDELFEPLATRIAEVSGIRVPISKRWLLAARVADRVRALSRGESEIHAYVREVLGEGGEAELGQLVEAVRVGETQFFRHQGQLRAIRRVGLPEIVARLESDRSRRVRVWSAGCATGEEAYTLAMMLEDELPRAEGWAHEILATDMSERALGAAREGRYPAASIHGVPAHVARWAFDRRGEDVVVSARARHGVRFERRNLLDESYPQGFDLVLCRNVLIYFDRATQREVLERLARSVVVGGYLALGYAERLDDGAQGLAPIRTDDGVVYRRGEGDTVVASADAREPRSPARAQVRVRASADSGERRESTSGEATGAPALARASRSVPPPRAHAGARGSGFERSVPALEGELEGHEGETAATEAVGRAMRAPQPVIDLRDLRYADETVGRVLARAAAALAGEGRALVLITSASGTLRFLRRHNVVPPAETRAEPPEGDTP